MNEPTIYTQWQADVFVILSFAGGLLLGILICYVDDRPWKHKSKQP